MWGWGRGGGGGVGDECIPQEPEPNNCWNDWPCKFRKHKAFRGSGACSPGRSLKLEVLKLLEMHRNCHFYHHYVILYHFKPFYDPIRRTFLAPGGVRTLLPTDLYNTTQHNTTQHNTTQNNTTKCWDNTIDLHTNKIILDQQVCPCE